MQWEVVLAASQCRTTVSEVYQTAQAAPAAGAWGCETASASSKYVASVNTSAVGVITVTASNAADLPEAVRGTTITLSPTDSSGTKLAAFAVATQVGGFKCEPGTMPAKYLPGSCR